MKTIFCLLLLAFAANAATLDEQITAANRAADSLEVVAQRLGSIKSAARLDSLYQADSTLTADTIRVVGGGVDSMWVKVAMDRLSLSDFREAKYALKDAGLDFRQVATDTLYMRRDQAEKARPVISAALRE